MALGSYTTFSPDVTIAPRGALGGLKFDDGPRDYLTIGCAPGGGEARFLRKIIAACTDRLAQIETVPAALVKDVAGVKP